MSGASKLFWALLRRRIVVEAPARLSEPELRAAFNVSSDNRLWRAVLQCLADVQDEAKTAAETTVASPGLSASCVGGGEFLTRLRDRMILEREKAIRQPVGQ